MKTSKQTRTMVQTSLLIALITVLSLTPIGYVPIGAISATTIHIPVIIGAILMGPKIGALLGGYFGLTSLLRSTFNPSPTSFVFSPFYSIGSISGNFSSLLICFIPRILIGVVAGYLFIFVFNKYKKVSIASIISGLFGSITNTVLVMLGIYFFFGKSYAAVQGVEISGLFSLIISVILINGVVEAIIASIISTAVTKPIITYFKK